MASWFQYFLLSFIFGIFIRSFFVVSPLFFITLAIISTTATLIVDRRKWRLKIWLIIGICICISLGIFKTERAFSVRDELKTHYSPSFVLPIKEKLQQSNRKILPSPESELLGAIVFNDQQFLSREVKNSFSKTGLNHITAISGMNITIITSFLIALSGSKRKSKTVFLCIVSFVCFYIALVGFPPSGVRAGIMAIIALFAQTVRRAYVVDRSLSVAAFSMLFYDPLLLRFDIGFQLSFLALLGLMYISPLFIFWFNQKIRGFRFFKEIIAMTCGAQIATTPIILFHFGMFSLIAPFANIIVVPLLLPLMIGGIFAISIGVFSPSLGMVLVFPIFWLLQYIFWIIDTLAKLAISSFALEHVHFSFVIFYYLALISAIVRLRKKFPLIFETQEVREFPHIIPASTH